MNVVSVLFKPLYNGYLSTTATFFCSEGHRCGEVQLLKKKNTRHRHTLCHWFNRFVIACCLLGPGGGGVLPYVSYIGMCSPIGSVFAPFWSENRYTLCPFWSGIGYGFRGKYGSVWRYLSFQFQMTKKEREIREIEMDLENFFVCALI